MPRRKNNRNNNNRRRNNRGIPRGGSLPNQAILFGNGVDNKANVVVRSGYYDLIIAKGTTSAHGMSFLQTGFYIDTTFVSWPAGATDLAALYDFYRLDRVNVTAMYNYNSAANNGGTSNTLPFFFYAVDVNDATGYTISDIAQMSTCECVMGGNNTNNMLWSKSFTPRAQLQAYAGISTGYAEAPIGTWFNSGSTPIHYGFKWASDTTATTDTTGNMGYIRIFVKCFLSAKQPK